MCRSFSKALTHCSNSNTLRALETITQHNTYHNNFNFNLVCSYLIFTTKKQRYYNKEKVFEVFVNCIIGSLYQIIFL